MRLLLIRPGALGDTLLTFPVIEALRAHSPNPHVTLVGNKAVLPLAHAFGLAEEVFDYEDPLWSGLFATPPSNCWTDYANVQINLNAQPTAGTSLSRPSPPTAGTGDAVSQINQDTQPISAGTDLSCPPPTSAGTNLSRLPPPTAGTDLSCPPDKEITRVDITNHETLQICRDPIYRVRDSSMNYSCKNNDKSAYTINRVPTTDKNPYANGIGRKPSLRDVLFGTDRAIAWLSDPDDIVRQNLQSAGVPHVTVVPGRPPAQERIHIVDYLARSVGVSTNPHPRYGNCSSVADDNAPAQERAFAIHPGSGGARKCWPPERFAAVIRRLWQRGWPVLLLSGPADHERLETLLKLLPVPPQPALLKLLVDVPLLDLLPVLCQCRGYLGNDSGMTHLAALLGLPTLALFGPTDPLIWQPRGRAVRIIHELDLEKLEADRVIEYIVL